MAPTRFQRLLAPVVGGLLALLAGATLVTGTGVDSIADAVQWAAMGTAGALWLATALWRDDPDAWSTGFGAGLAFGGVGYATPAVEAVAAGNTGGGWGFVRVVVGAAIVVWGLRYATLGMDRIAPPGGDRKSGDGGGGGGDGGGS